MFFFLETADSRHEKLIISYQVNHIIDSVQEQLWVVKDKGVTDIGFISEAKEPRHIIRIDDASTFDFDGFVKDFIRQEDLRGSWADISGIITVERWDELVSGYTDDFNRRRDGYIEKQEQNPSEIYQLVKELNLHPFNPGYNAYSWYANCPGGHHNLMFSTKSNGWGCGYCKEKGGLDELREFYKSSDNKLDG